MREFDGSGIGLAVTKQLVDLMKGSLCLDTKDTPGGRIEQNGSS